MKRTATLLLFLGLGACATERVRTLPVVDTSAVTLVVEEEGPWREVASPRPNEAPVAAPTPAPSPVVVPTPVSAPAAPALPVPVRRTPEPPRGVPPTRSLEDLARERHLSNPTRIRAARITFRCPTEYATEVRTTAERSRAEPGGRRVLDGGARLTCRELTLEADSIVFQVREAPGADLQIAARGGVSYVSDQAGRVFREEGVKSLLITNDRVVPLR